MIERLLARAKALLAPLPAPRRADPAPVTPAPAGASGWRQPTAWIVAASGSVARSVRSGVGAIALAASTTFGRLKPERTGGVVSQPSSAGGLNGIWARYQDLQWLGAYTPDDVPMRVRKLMRRDSQIHLGLQTLKSPLFGIEYYARGGSPRAAAYLRAVLLKTSVLSDVLWSILRSLDFGFSVAELVYDQGPLEIDLDGRGPEPAVTVPNAVSIQRVRGFEPESCELYADETGALSGVKVSGQSLLPDQVLFAVNQHEHEDPAHPAKGLLGEAVVDRVYPHFYSCAVNVHSLNRYLDSKGNPPLIATAPNEWRNGKNARGEDEPAFHCMTVLNEALLALKNGGVCSVPAEFDKDGNPLWSIQTLDVKDRVEQFLPSIQYDQTMKLRGMGVPERTVTQDSTVGSFAMSDTHLDTFLAGLEVTKVRTVLGALNVLARRLVRLTFGAAEPCPEIDATQLSRAKIETLLKTLQATLGTVHTLPDGRQFTTEQLLDPVGMIRAANLPMNRVEDVARLPERPAPSAPTAPTQPTALASDGLGGGLVVNVAPSPAPNVTVSAAPAPNVVNEITVAPSPAPNVTVAPGPAPNVTVRPVVKGPDVHVHPELKVSAPDVTVNVEAPDVTVNVPPPVRKDVKIVEGANGKLEAQIIPRPLES